MKKRLFSLLLCLCITTGICSHAFAIESTEDLTANAAHVIPVSIAALCYDRTTEQTVLSGNAARGWLMYQLWLENGAPQPSADVTDLNFSDVSEEDYFYDAVVWAVENGITAGTDMRHFSPEEVCTRAQVITFLYRAEGTETTANDLPYTDVTEQNFWYIPVQWAYQNGLLNSSTATDSSLLAAVRDGIEYTKFHPDDAVTFTLREQIDYTVQITPYCYEDKTDGVVVTATGIGEYTGTITRIFHDNHTAASAWTTVKSVTCTEDGIRQKLCTQCGEIVMEQHIPATGHKEAIRKGFAASCSKSGLSDGSYCSVCQMILKGQEILPKAPHSFTSYVYNNNPRPGVDGTETAVCDNGCGATDTRSRAGTALPLKPEHAVEAFEDVSADSYCALPIAWALAKNITAGIGDGSTFAPNAVCTRAQIVTFLWRANGSPEPEGIYSPFSDVSNRTAYYYKAVLWAVEQGITSGSTETLFAPNEVCTRAQAATFLWRAEKQPQPTAQVTAFTDVPNGAWYSDAIAWAVQNNITNGISASKFEPDMVCTRGQIVTFLYRDMG